MTLLMVPVCNSPSCLIVNGSFGLQEFGNIYSRIMNPTNDVFEKVCKPISDV